jgi:hypothetical protein
MNSATTIKKGPAGTRVVFKATTAYDKILLVESNFLISGVTILRRHQLPVDAPVVAYQEFFGHEIH